MDLFSRAIGAPVGEQLATSIIQQSQAAWNALSDTTRGIFDASQKLMQSIAPRVTLEQVERTKAMVGSVFNDKQLELHTSLYSLQTSNTFTGYSTLAHPALADMHRLGQIEAYGIEYSELRNTLLNRRINSGVGGLSGEGYVVVNEADNYRGELSAGYDKLSSLSKQIIRHNQQRALASIFEESVDPTSIHDAEF